MIFSSVSFIYYFLPIFLIFYYLTKDKYRNITLLIFSFVFYFFEEPKYIVVLFLSCIVNYLLSKKIEKSNSKKYLLIALIYNVLQLIVFKYIDFFINNINIIFKTRIPLTYIKMPIGISFFTFQALGYVIDVYNKKHKSAKKLIEFATYISLFPQLIAGPIVRYSDIHKDLHHREVNFDRFKDGINRFTIGLSKKVLIANVLGEFTKSLTEVNLLSSWLKPIGYTLQIYFDFSGYSDMAIGLGLMIGFKFLENFNYPLIANSITDFWRRWHISLSKWFRDYIYIPLGGNRVSNFKWIRNVLVVWLLTGFWHGANWNFIIWGLYFGILLIIEKKFLKKFLDRIKVIKYVYTLLIIVISFLIFNSTSLNEIMVCINNMFLINKINLVSPETIYYLKDYLVLLIISIIGSTPLPKIIIKKVQSTKFKVLIDIMEPIFYIVLLVLSTAFIIDESFNPFLYFRF